MAYMKSLTVSGQTYQVKDPEAVSVTAQQLTPAQQAQARENLDVASTKAILDKLCPSFTESGVVVTCAPVEGYPLAVVSQITPMQAGEGEPSPENIRPIYGTAAIELVRENEYGSNDYFHDFGREIYSGTLDWNTGTLTGNAAFITFTGDENWEIVESEVNPIYSYVYLHIGQFGYMDAGYNHLCSHFKHVAISGGNLNLGIYVVNSKGYNDARILARPKAGITVDEWTAFLAEQYAAGRPVQVCYGVTEPEVIQLPPREIPALQGSNTLYCDSGEIEVRGKADPVAIINKLTNAILSLGGNV